MIRRNEPEILQCICDGCQKNCMDPPYGPHHASLKASFGYGSRLDDEASSFHLCEDCWEKALDAVGLKDHPMRGEMQS